MKPTTLLPTLFAGLALMLSTGSANARKKQVPSVPLTEVGEKLQAGYTARMEALKAEIAEALPTLDAGRKQAYIKAREAENAAEEALKKVQANQQEIKKGLGAVGHAKNKWIKGAEKGLKKTREALKKAKTAAEKEKLQAQLAHWQQNKQDGLDALRARQAKLDAALEQFPNVEKNLENAKAALKAAKAATVEAVLELGITELLQSDKLDARLAEYSVLLDATPRALATFAQQGADSRKHIDRMLADADLLVQIAVADGAAGGHYGRAMQIYQAIQNTSSKASSGTLQKLALAMALEHARPIKQRNAKGAKDAPEFVDPVKRYLAYEKAFLAKALDPGFDDHNVYALRHVVNGEEPDQIAAWGRKMLANYRPDHITMSDYRWRYVGLVRSDIRYGSQDNQYDEDRLQFFQNILKNGGICGRRAFIGRFILRAFGVPTTARPQRGHAALAHWTPDGWVVCLGAGWGHGWTKLPYRDDLDFLATTQARMLGEPYKQVKRAHWIGDAMGEKRAYGFLSTKEALPFWNAVALYTQRNLIEQHQVETLAAVGEDIGEANETKEKVEIIEVDLSEDDRQVKLAANGTITIPAAATSKPTQSSGKIIFMPSNRGGLQMHYARNGGDKTFEYTFEAPKAGNYDLTAMVCTPSWKQNLLITANAAGDPVKLELPHTVGMWQATNPVTVELKKGENVLTFDHQTEGYAKGFTIQQFTLTPAT